MKILNLYAGIGGNRHLWDSIQKDLKITAVENNKNIAKIYQDFFPKDKVIVADAHQYLLEHFKEFDFIWSSPPCPTHSRIRINTAVASGHSKPVYPNMWLYQEIILLKHYFKGKWCIENVIAFYKPLITPLEFGKHWFWTNFYVRPIKVKTREVGKSKIDFLQKHNGFDLSNYSNIGVTKQVILHNCVDSKLGLHILNESKKCLYTNLFKKL